MYECKIRPYHPALLSSPSPCRPPGLAGSGWRPRRTPPGFAAKRSWSAPGRPLVDNQMLTDMDPHNYKTWQCDNVFLSSAVACHKNRTIEQWTVNMDQDATVNSEQCTLTITNICYKFDLCNINLKGPWGRSTAQHHSAWHGRSGEHSWRSSKCLPSKSGGDSITISLPSFLNVYTTKPHLHLARTRSSQLGADLGTSLRPMPCAADGGSAAPWTQATPRCSPAEQGHFH